MNPHEGNVVSIRHGTKDQPIGLLIRYEQGGDVAIVRPFYSEPDSLLTYYSGDLTGQSDQVLDPTQQAWVDSVRAEAGFPTSSHFDHRLAAEPSTY